MGFELLRSPAPSAYGRTAVVALLCASAWIAASEPARAETDQVANLVIDPLPGAAIQAQAIPAIVPPLPSPLWEGRDPALERRLEQRLERLGLGSAIAHQKLGVALVDLTSPDKPRVAAVNGDVMLYAASLPKIAVLLAAFERIAAGQLTLDVNTESLLRKMIRRSSNLAATALMQAVGKPFIAETLLSPRYALYDMSHNGGLWAGKDYGQAGLWQRDPLHSLSHGATAMQVARFYHLLDTGRLVNAERSEQMKEILADSEINHKFIKALGHIDPSARAYRKSGTWQNWHSDSALVERAGHRYIAVGLCESPRGSLWLEEIFPELDRLVVGRTPHPS